MNRLCLNWKTDERFDMSFSTLMKGFNSSMICYNISMFKPTIAKYMYEKYSNINDVIYDYSAGWGGRMLGAASCNRQYIGVDPLTISSLSKMKEDLELKNIKLIQGKSEDIVLEENSIDFAFSSPPYYNIEIYSDNNNQAYNKGEDYFYNTYWNNTLKNIQYMLKPNKCFALNVAGVPKMVDYAKEYFGYIIDTVEFTMPRNQNNRKNKQGLNKSEYIYIFRNLK